MIVKPPPIYGSTSSCHKSPSLIVLSRKSGFLTQNCLTCGEPRFLPERDLPHFQCGTCELELKAFRNVAKNYALKCPQGHEEFELASLVPYWAERFNYHGFGLDSDYLYDYHKRPVVIKLTNVRFLKGPS